MPSWKFLWKASPCEPVILEVTLEGDRFETSSNVDTYEGGYAVRIEPWADATHLKAIIAGAPGCGIGAVLLYCFADAAPTELISTGTVALDARGFYECMGFEIDPEVVEKASSRYDEYVTKSDGSCDLSRDEYMGKMLNMADWFVSRDKLLQVAGDSLSKKWEPVTQDYLDALLEIIEFHAASARSHYMRLKEYAAIGAKSDREALRETATAIIEHAKFFGQVAPMATILLTDHRDQIKTMSESIEIFSSRAVMAEAAVRGSDCSV